MSRMERNPLPLLLLASLVSVGVGVGLRHFMAVERTESVFTSLYERVDAVIAILWLVVLLILILAGWFYVS